MLIGDAAHAPLQSLAQGACMAIEDGFCLAELIHASDGDFAAAFRRFEAARLLRTARVQLESRAMWPFYHAEGIARDVRNATVAEWYKNHGKHEIYAKGKNVNLQSFEHSLKIDAEDAARVRHLEHDVPVTAAEEDRARRKKAYEEQAKVRAIYEELVLKKPQPTVVQIGTVSDIAKAVPANFANAGKPVTIAPANGNGNGHSNGNGAPSERKSEPAAEAVAGD